MLTKRELHQATRAALVNERSSWNSHWQDLQQNILPRRGRFLETDVNKGSKKNAAIIDNTGTLAARTLASGMMAGITSPSRPWFRLSPPDPGMKEFAPVKEWTDLIERLILEIFARSNVYNALHVGYGELGTFGTMPIYIQADFKDVIRAFPLTIGSYYMSTDDRNSVNTIYRDMPMTVQQVVKMFGIDKVMQSTRSMYEKGQYQSWITVYHAIEPNNDRNITKLDNGNMATKSSYWEKGSNESQYLRESGYEDFPVMAPRWEVLGNDVYGRSAGMDALGDVRQLQVQQRAKAKGIAKQIDPPMVGPPALKGKGSNTLPGGVTFTEPVGNGNPGFTPAYQVNFDVGAIREDIYETQLRIKRAYYEDLFLMVIQSDRRQITAREIEEKHEEKLLMLGPVMERLNDELLGPLIDRTFNLALRAGIVPPPPKELEAGGKLKVEYISIMAQAQKMVGTTGLERLAGFVAEVSQIQSDKFDVDQAIDEYSDMLGTPSGIVNSDDEVEAIRKDRAAKEEQARNMAIAAEAANIAKTASEADTGGENALTNMLDAVPGGDSNSIGIPGT